jgi:hypothetical protein
VCSLIARERIHRFSPNFAFLFLETKKRIYEGQTPKMCSEFRVPVRAVPVARKLRTIEERRQDQSCLFRRGDYTNKGHNHDKNLSWVLGPVKMVSVARKVSTIDERRIEQNCLFQRGDYRN